MNKKKSKKRKGSIAVKSPLPQGIEKVPQSHHTDIMAVNIMMPDGTIITNLEQFQSNAQQPSTPDSD